MPSQTAGLGDKGNPQVTKELDKLGKIIVDVNR